MKLMVASDIHGSAYFCEKLVSRFKTENADMLLLLGDILYHGPRNALPYGYAPDKTAKMLNDIKENILCVRGNCDSEVDQMVLDFPIMADYAVLYADNKIFFATHGHKYNIDNLPPLKNGTVFLSGHTHIPSCKSEKGYVFINPGSVSIPKGLSQNQYMIIDKGSCISKDTDGNILDSNYF
ncbi:MAG: phosphodiesterase [Clostridia bacterium]|nr:phosphodiesterase [Clostridia bacterium]